jgi:acetate kinase
VRVLVVNAGSSSLKLALLEDERVVAAQQLDATRGVTDAAALEAALGVGGFGDADAVGHRIVHGGERFREPVLVDDDVRRALDELTDLAPLHQPAALAVLDRVRDALPGVPAVACFDTAFHSTLAPAATTYALPAAWRERFGLRRFGFHGLSHAHVGRRVGELLGDDGSAPRIVSCHLGAGASLCAIADGRSVDTTMGFTPLEGLVMATRSGSVDPGLIAWLIEHGGLAPGDVFYALEHESGLTGLAGTGDLRELHAREVGGDPDATLAIDVYIHRLCGQIAAMAAALGGLDALAFTGGVGEHDATVRARTAAGLAFLGVAVDDARNATADGDDVISPDGSDVTTFVITAREDLEIARGVRGVVV